MNAADEDIGLDEKVNLTMTKGDLMMLLIGMRVGSVLSRHLKSVPPALHPPIALTTLVNGILNTSVKYHQVVPPQFTRLADEAAIGLLKDIGLSAYTFEDFEVEVQCLMELQSSASTTGARPSPP